MKKTVTYKDWHIPFKRNSILLKDAQDSLQQVGANSEEVPLIVRLIENPKLGLPGLDFFHGAVELEHHDLIHIILGRGLLAVDEAFTIGFTMGSTQKVTTTEEILYTWIAKNLYPKDYKFNDIEIEVFKNAVRLGSISNCLALDSIQLSNYLEWPIKSVREKIGLECNLLMAYYEVEKNRYPDSISSQRLLDN